MKNVLQLFVISLIFLTGCFNHSDTQVRDAKFQKKLQSLLWHNVKEISVIETKQLTDVIYLDSRAKTEYDVSHIKDALWVGYDDFDITSVANLNKSQTIVTYCSIGYRSEKITKLLEKEGFKTVYNLYGGLFEWYNEGFPIVDNHEKTTDKIHAYNKKWSQWVDGRKNGDVVY